MANTIKLRRGTAAQWTSANSVLASGEPGFETDTNKFKIGNGSDPWNNLPYTAIDPSTASSIYASISYVESTYLPISASFNPEGYLTEASASSIYSPLASPTFTGTPIAPTAASGTNTTQIATTEFVRTEISGLIDTAPSTLDTLNELAAALGDDPNFSTTITNSLAAKLDSATASVTYAAIESPTFTGIPLAPTASVGTNTTQIATTAYVQSSLSGVQPTIHPMFIIGGI